MQTEKQLCYTGKGDGGKTSTLSGSCVSKCDSVVEANGAVDELQTSIGVSRSFLSENSKDIDTILKKVQRDLFAIGAEINSAGKKLEMRKLDESAVRELENAIDYIAGNLERLDRFVISSGPPACTFLHNSRAVCRRVERIVVDFSRENIINENAVPYLNRLSSLLFVLARLAAKREGFVEEKWKGNKLMK